MDDLNIFHPQMEQQQQEGLVGEPGYILDKKRLWKGNVDIIGAIFFDNRHAYLKQIIRDKDFFNALDSISGHDWDIYALGTTITNQQEAEREIKKTLIHFGQEKYSDHLPFLAIIARVENDCFEFYVVKLNDTNTDIAYNKLRDSIELATRVIEKIPQKNYRNSAAKLKAIRSSFWCKDFKAFLKKVVDFLIKNQLG